MAYRLMASVRRFDSLDFCNILRTLSVSVVAAFVVLAIEVAAQNATNMPRAELTAAAQQSSSSPQPAGPATLPAAAATPKPKKSQAELETELSKLLSGATLEGSFTTTGPGQDGARLSADKYTLGEVRKLAGNTWMIQARMRDAMIPLPLPIEWAGDTPVIVVEDFTIPGMGTFSARVMFYADHYAGYWKHDERGGSMFGVIHRANAAAAPAAAPASSNPPPIGQDKSKQ